MHSREALYPTTHPDREPPREGPANPSDLSSMPSFVGEENSRPCNESVLFRCAGGDRPSAIHFARQRAGGGTPPSTAPKQDGEIPRCQVLIVTLYGEAGVP